MAVIATGALQVLYDACGFDALRNRLEAHTFQCDEIWSFCYATDKNVPEEKRGTFGFGDVWTWARFSRMDQSDIDLVLLTAQRMARKKRR